VLLGVIADEEELREVALAAHWEREQAAGEGTQFHDSDVGWRRRRRQAACDRRLLRVLEALLQRSRDARVGVRRAQVGPLDEGGGPGRGASHRRVARSAVRRPRRERDE